MRSARGWAVVVIVCCAVAVRAEEAPQDASLVQAQRDLDEARKLNKEGKYAEAVPLVERALEIREKTRGPKHPEVAECLNLLGDLERKQGKYTQAEPLLQRAIQIREATLGKNHPDVANSLNILAVLYASQGLYGRAETLYQRAIQIQEVALGKNHLYVANSINNLAILYHDQGLYDLAGQLYDRALKIKESALGKNHPDVARTINNLAVQYTTQGLYDRAEPLYQRVLQIREAALGGEHPDVASVLENLAHLYYEQGFYDRAEPLYQRALRISEAALGENHPDVAALIENLANVYAGQGFYERAEPLYQRALKIREVVFGKENPDVSHSLINLSNCYFDQGSYEHAESLLQRALQIRETALGRNHPEVAVPLINLANLYYVQGLYAKAEQLYQHAIQIWEAALGENHPYVAISLDKLGCLYRVQGLFDRARPLHERALQVLDTDRGKNNPALIELLRDTALLEIAQDQLAPALSFFQRSFASSERRLRAESVTFSEARLAGFLKLLRADEQIHYNLLREHPSEPAVLRLALTTALLRKGRSAAELADTARAIYRNLGPADRETFEHLRILRSQFSALSLAGPEKLTPATYQARLKDLEVRAEALEAELVQHSALFRSKRQLPGPDDVIARVAAALPANGALVEFVAFSASPVVPPINTPPAKVPSTPSYLALILLASGDIHAVDLGKAEAIDGAVRRLRLVFSSSQAENYLPAAQELYRLVLQPLVPLLGAQRRLFIAPDGQLNLVPFDALHDGTRHLADAFDITYLTSGKDLVRKSEEAPTGRSVVVLADPDFGSTPSALAVRRGDASAPPAPTILERSASVESFFAHDRSGLTNETWEALPGTRQEALAIHKLLPQARLLLGPAATKQALLEVAAPGILHVATHGFFLGDTAGPPGTRGKQSIGAPAETPSALLLSNPLLRSGLVLAGAQAAKAPGTDADSDSRAEATLATALELAGVNLWGTELVVLSACDTGRGEVKPGQGVYGLRRAFTVAGAETLVMSLWKVNDQTTHEFMKDFYKGLKVGQGRAEALREAMRRMRKRHSHPYYWAPFILVGNGAPLRSLALPHATSPHPGH